MSYETLSRQYRKYVKPNKSDQWQEWTKTPFGNYEWRNINYNPLEKNSEN